MGVLVLDVFYHINLVVRISLRRINDDDVDASVNKKSNSFSVFKSGADGSSDKQLLAAILRC